MLRRNLIANFVGQGWTALMGIAFLPVYIRYLGIEAFGLVSIFGLLQSWLVLLDMGMKPAVGREMARFTGGARDAQSLRDLLRSVEIVALGVATLIATGIWTSAGWLATHWLKAEQLPVETMWQAFILMGFVAALRFVEGIYSSSVVGLQQQVLFNIFSGVAATVRALGAIAVIAWVSPTIEAFFIWQAAVSLASVLVLMSMTYGLLPQALRPGRFSLSSLRSVWRFAGGMLGITFLTLMLTQVDKILLSRLLALGDYGYYSLAAVVANGLYMLVGPITQAFFPRMNQLSASSAERELVEAYHVGSQLVSVVVGSAAIMLAMFAAPILTLWTRDAAIASHSAQLLSVLALGNLLNCLMMIPYHTQLAYGWVRLSVVINILAVIVIVPAILIVTPRFGALGAAWVWVSLNAGYVLVGAHFMFRRILRGEKWRWYLRDILQPLLAAAVTCSVSFVLMPEAQGVVARLLWLLFTAAAMILAAAASAPTVRKMLLELRVAIGRRKDPVKA